MAYIERNPVRAGLCARAKDYPWSSAQAHVEETSQGGLLDLKAWRQEYDGRAWEGILDTGSEDDDFRHRLREATLRGRPCCDPDTLKVFERRLGRRLRPDPPGRPRKQAPEEEATQIGFAFGG